MAFPHTQWTLLALAARRDSEEANQAWAEFYRQYQLPVLEFIRRRNHGVFDPENTAQAFFLHLLKGELLVRADVTRGKFRSFLLGALLRFMAHERERTRAEKRGGDAERIDLDSAASAGEEPSAPAADVAAYDRTWALEILRRSLDAVAADYKGRGRERLFSELRAYLPGAKDAPPAYLEVAARLDMSEASFKTEIHRVRQRLRDRMQREVAVTVASPTEVDEEIAYLGRVLREVHE